MAATMSRRPSLSRSTNCAARHAVEAVDRRRREAPAPVAGGEDARRPGAAEEEVGEAVLVHVGGGDRGDSGRRGAQRRQADVAGDVGERAVAQVLEQRRRAGAARDQQIDVAAIVHVGRHDGDRPLRHLRDPRCGRHVGERAVAVVAQQDRRGAADDEIEVAVVVGVDERDRRWRTGGRRNAGRLGGVLEGPVGALVQQRMLLHAEHEQIGALVVVVVARDRGDERRRQRQRRQAFGGRDVAERPARVVQDAQARPRIDEIEVAVQVEIDEGRAVGGLSFTAQRRPGRERHRGHRRRGRAFVARRRHRFGVASLFEVVVREGGAVAGFAQRLELRDRLLPFLGLAGARQRDAEVVERGHVVRLRRDRRPQQIEGAVVLALLHRQLRQVHSRAEVRVVDGQHLRELGVGDVGLILGLGDQAEDVVRLRCVGRRGGGLLRGYGGGREIRHVEQRDGEVDPGETERGIDLERAAEALGGVGVVVLLEQRDADVVGAVGVLPRRGGRGRGSLSGAQADAGSEARRQRGREQKHESWHVSPALVPAAGRVPRGPLLQRYFSGPRPSTIVMARLASTDPIVSTWPLGQRTSRPATRASAPRPKVSGSSLWDR